MNYIEYFLVTAAALYVLWYFLLVILVIRDYLKGKAEYKKAVDKAWNRPPHSKFDQRMRDWLAKQPNGKETYFNSGRSATNKKVEEDSDYDYNDE